MSAEEPTAPLSEQLAPQLEVLRPNIPLSERMLMRELGEAIPGEPIGEVPEVEIPEVILPPVNTQRFQLVPDISGDDADDTASLLDMARSAREYIKSFAWCPPIKAMYLAHGVGGVVAVFFVEFPRKIKGTDDKFMDRCRGFAERLLGC